MKHKWYWIYSNVCRNWILYQLRNGHLYCKCYTSYDNIREETLPIPFDQIDKKYVRQAAKEEVMEEVVNNFGWVKDDCTKYSEEDI